MTPTQLIEMKLHDESTNTLKNGYVTILRVLTGWIYFYYFDKIDLLESVHVPESNMEFLQTIEA